MTAVSERDHARAHGRVARFAAVALALSVVACFTGQDKDSGQPSGIIGPTGGGGSTTGGGSQNAFDGTYHLTLVNDSTLPVMLANDSTSGTGVSGDTTRVFIATIDSSVLYLNSDSTAEEIDALTIRDARTATDSSFERDISFADTTFGDYNASSTTVTVSLVDTVGGLHTVVNTYTQSGKTLTGSVLYQLFYTDGPLAAAGAASYVYTNTGLPLHSVVGAGSLAASQAVAALRTSPRTPISGGARGSVPRMWRVPSVAALRRVARLALARTRS